MLEAEFRKGCDELTRIYPPRLYGIERHQRIQIFGDALAKGRPYRTAIRIAMRFPKAWLPEIVFQVINA